MFRLYCTGVSPIQRGHVHKELRIGISIFSLTLFHVIVQSRVPKRVLGFAASSPEHLSWVILALAASQSSAQTSAASHTLLLLWAQRIPTSGKVSVTLQVYNLILRTYKSLGSNIQFMCERHWKEKNGSINLRIIRLKSNPINQLLSSSSVLFQPKGRVIHKSYKFVLSQHCTWHFILLKNKYPSA